MRSKILLALPLSLTPLMGLAMTLPSGGPSGSTQSAPALEPATRPFFAKNCLSCHNAATKAGGLDLAVLQRPESMRKNRDSWESVLRKISTGEMPPPGSPRPAAADVKATSARIEAELERLDKRDAANPGRVTARRLNRAEYNNTVRDLLGVDIRPADDFPQDDSGYGFDNIGDVLSLSSSQMERYVTAAEKIARTALFGPEKLQPTLAFLETRRRQIVNTMTIPTHYDVSGFTLPNSLHATHKFPTEGEYLLRIKLDGLRPLGSDALHLALWIDGKKRQTFDFDPTGQAAFNPDRQDFSARTVECRLRVSGGEHWIAAVVERMYEGLPAQYGGPNPSTRVIPVAEFKPPPGLSAERIAQIKARIEARSKEKVPVNDAHVSGLQVGGPYAQTEGPSPESLRKIFTCGHLHGGHTPDCARRIISDVGSRAFRRPLTPQEITRYTQLVAQVRSQGDSFEEGICLALQGLLVSPHFLYRIERDPAPTSVNTASNAPTSVVTASNAPPDKAAHLISPYELASRLSYFLWSTLPDETLRQCAAQGTLRQPAVLKAQIQRMLKDPKANALAENFAGQWLQIRALESAKPDRGRFPDFDDYLRMSMRQETEQFFENIVHEDGSIVDLLVGKYTFLNERLANFYGIPGVEGPAFRKVELANSPRGGILTQASVLTVTSYPNRTSPVLRGKWILENILNAPPPAPPPGVPALDEAKVGKDASLRQQLEEHRKNPTCASCHARMDPLGFGLENFDAVGAWRANDGKFAVDSTGSLPDGRSFKGPDGLKTILKADRSAFAQCLTSKLLTYALGRGLEGYDRATVKEITAHNAANDYRFSNLVLEIVTSRPFQMRRGDRTP
jgi:mono/diheme cytochrome c family protein